MQNNGIIVVEGGQFGSEGKGMIAAELCLRRKVRWAVRTGAVNAGHTVYYNGRAYKMQQIPVGWVNPETTLILGAGTMIHPEILENEIRMLRNEAHVDVLPRLFIDYRAGLHLPKHHERAKNAGRTNLIGATGEGCSEALCEKIRGRGTSGMLFRQWLADAAGFPDVQIRDTVNLLNEAYDRNETILLEGTQGSGLDLHLGPYPYTTHKQTQAGQWAIEAGLGLGLKYEVILVVRTYPIRVAGNSGPLNHEMTWPDLARRINSALEMSGREPRVRPSSLLAFEAACVEVGERLHGLDDYASLNMHKMGREWKENHSKAIRDLHRDALLTLPDDVQADLLRLFEMTTVTKRLRRVAELSLSDVRRAIQLNRPSNIALTFFNYAHPELWDTSVTSLAMGGAPEWEGAMATIRSFEQDLGPGAPPVRMISTGPLGENLIEVAVS